MYGLDFAEALRDNDTGLRYQQKVKITLYEYNPPTSQKSQYFNLPPTTVAVTNGGSTPSGGTPGTTNQPPTSKRIIVPNNVRTLSALITFLYGKKPANSPSYYQTWLVANNPTFTISGLQLGIWAGKYIKVPIQ
jgi:hypothetical protein